MWFKRKRCKHDWKNAGEHVVDYRPLGGDRVLEMVIYCPYCDTSKSLKKDNAMIELEKSRIRKQMGDR